MTVARAFEQPSRSESRREGRLVLAAGGYRSGSTLQYNLVGEYLERTGGGCRAGYLEGDAARSLLPIWSLIDHAGLAVVKVHFAVTGTAQGASPSWLELVAGGRAVPLVTLRDWRDVAASMCRKFAIDIHDLATSRAWQDNLVELDAWLGAGALAQSYEVLTTDPVGALSEVARHLGLPWDAPAALDAADAVAAPRAVEVQHALQAGTYHPRLLLHHDHVFSPFGGSWRSWARRDRRALDKLVATVVTRPGIPASTGPAMAARIAS